MCQTDPGSLSGFFSIHGIGTVTEPRCVSTPPIRQSCAGLLRAGVLGSFALWSLACDHPYPVSAAPAAVTHMVEKLFLLARLSHTALSVVLFQWKERNSRPAEVST